MNLAIVSEMSSGFGLEVVDLEKQRRRGRGWQPRRMRDSAMEAESGGQ